VNGPQHFEFVNKASDSFDLYSYLECFSDAPTIAAYKDSLWKEFDLCEKRIREKQVLIQKTQKTIQSLKSSFQKQKNR
jgi:hypothetical protein